MHLLLHGNGYVQIACDAEGVPAELFALRPERVSVEADARGRSQALWAGSGREHPDALGELLQSAHVAQTSS